jgi:23S rRNA (guanosine2251-2'-O)-methyltransferase
MRDQGLIEVRNPHSILAALQRRPEDVKQVMMPADGAAAGDAWEQIVDLARHHGVRLEEPEDPHRARNSGKHHYGSFTPKAERKAEKRGADLGGRVSAACARIRPKGDTPIETLFENAKKRVGGNGLWLALDTLTDPQNVGSIFRTAAFFGVQGIVMTEERSAPINSAVYDVSCGGVESVPFTVHTNLQRAFEKAKDAGLWILGTSEHAKDSITTLKADRPWLLVLGNEERGMRRLTAESCDVTCAVPPAKDAGVTSLNVSAAAAALIVRLSL